MRVAVCFWGICRSTDSTLPSIETFIYEPLRKAGIEYDVFVHTFSITGRYINKRAKEDTYLNNSLFKLLKPSRYVIEEQEYVDANLDFENFRSKGDAWNNEFQTLDNHIRALYSLSIVSQMWIGQGDYDYIIYVRPDVRFKTPIKIDWLSGLSENEIIMPHFHRLPVNDRFAIAKPTAATIYGMRYLASQKFASKYPLHAETYLDFILKSNGIQEKTVSFPFNRVRVGGEELPDTD